MEIKRGYKLTELGVIPEEWDIRTLASVSEKIMVGIASAATHAYRTKGIPLLRNQNIRAGHLDDSDILFVDSGYEKTFRNKRLRTGDLLTARTGYPGMTCVVPAAYDSAQSFTTLITRPKPGEVESTFLCWFINSAQGQRFFNQSQIGGAQKNVNAGTLRKMAVPVPPPFEQRTIAEALSDVDDLLGGLDRLIIKKRELKQTAMQQLLTGQIRLPGFHSEWDTPCLSDLFTFKNGLNKAKHFFGYGTPIVNYMDVYEKRGLCASDLRGRVFLPREERRAFDVRKGDVFFTRTSETADEVGITSVMLDDPEDTVFSGFVLRGRPKDDSLDNRFKQYCFSTPAVRKQIVSQSTETTRALTNGRCLSVVVIARPPKAEQAAIAKVLTDMDAEIAVLEERRQKIRALKQAMMQELLTGKTRLI